MATEEINIKVKSDISETTKDASGLASEFKIMGVSLNDVKKGFAKVGAAAKASFATIKAGIMSTGIGALVIAVASLATYFTSTKRGADELKVAFTAMGAAIDVIRDRVSKFGEIIKNVFNRPLNETLSDVKDNFAGITEEITKEVKAMSALERRTQALRDADNEFMIQKAKTRQEIERARLIAEDETKSAQERLTNLKKALELEAETTKQELVLARERMKIQEEEMALSENSAEDEAELARLKTELIEKETASIKMRRRVVTEVNSLEREILAEEKARLKEKADAEKQAREKKEKEEAEAAKRKAEADEKARKEKEEADKAAAAREIAITESVNSAKLSLTKQAFGALGQLAGENEALGKGVAIAETIFNTQQGIMAAMGATSVADKLLPFPMRLANAALVGIMGANAIKNIMSAKRTGGGGGGAVAGGGAPAPQMTSGAFDLSGVDAPEPVQAYVVTDDMTNSQNKLETIRRRSTI